MSRDRKLYSQTTSVMDHQGGGNLSPRGEGARTQGAAEPPTDITMQSLIWYRVCQPTVRKPRYRINQCYTDHDSAIAFLSVRLSVTRSGIVLPRLNVTRSTLHGSRRILVHNASAPGEIPIGPPNGNGTIADWYINTGYTPLKPGRTLLGIWRRDTETTTTLHQQYAFTAFRRFLFFVFLH